jgi:hypothetical protein
MTKEKAPTREQRLNQNLGGTDYTETPKKSKKPKDFSHLKALKDLANTWVQRGYYSDTGRAYQALIEGVANETL